jgi:excinuclease UvrABC ATPase subunit
MALNGVWGESQIRLNRSQFFGNFKTLARPWAGYTLEKPTVGLHFEDEWKLLDVLSVPVEVRKSVLVIEQNLEVTRATGLIFDLGPKGGKGGRPHLRRGCVGTGRGDRGQPHMALPR